MNQNTNGMTGKICSKCGKPIFTGQEDISSTAVQHLVCPQDNESKTPRTVAEIVLISLNGYDHTDGNFEGVKANFARQLETKLLAAQQEIAELKRLGGEIADSITDYENTYPEDMTPRLRESRNDWQNHFKGKE